MQRTYNMSQHTLAVLVENSPGVLARVASLFSRRGYNIDSLTVGPTENPDISRMTIVLNLEGHALDQVNAQLFKLVNVIGIQEMKATESLQRELLMVKVSAKKRGDVLVIANKFKAVITDENEKTLTLEATGDRSGIDGLLAALAPFGIKELVQSGIIALERGKVTLAERTLTATGTAAPESPTSPSATADYQN